MTVGARVAIEATLPDHARESAAARPPRSAGAPTVMRFVVLVEFGERPVADATRRLQPHLRRWAATLIAVDTSTQLTLRDGTPVNDAFEFSGYQYGLERAIDAAASVENALVQIAFVNGTAFRSHLPAMLRYRLRSLFSSRGDGGVERPRADGFFHRAGPRNAAVVSLGFYIPTFAFSLSGGAADLDRVSLYDRGAVGVDGLAARLRAAGETYARAIDEWLSPVRMLRGWYQAVPNRPLDAATIYRKKLAIYLEHSMPAWLRSQGVELARPQGSRTTVADLLMSMDRLYVNALKVRFRVAQRLLARAGVARRTS